MNYLDVCDPLNEWKEVKLNLNGCVLSTKMGMTNLTDGSFLVFGGETANVTDSEVSIILNKESSDLYTAIKSNSLPVPCTPAMTSYMMNNCSFYYFLSNEGYVFRLNKLELKWTKW